MSDILNEFTVRLNTDDLHREVEAPAGQGEFIVRYYLWKDGTPNTKFYLKEDVYDEGRLDLVLAEVGVAELSDANAQVLARRAETADRRTDVEAAIAMLDAANP